MGVGNFEGCFGRGGKHRINFGPIQAQHAFSFFSSSQLPTSFKPTGVCGNGDPLLDCDHDIVELLQLDQFSSLLLLNYEDPTLHLSHAHRSKLLDGLAHSSRLNFALSYCAGIGETLR